MDKADEVNTVIIAPDATRSDAPYLRRQPTSDGINLAPELVDLVPANHADVLAARCPHHRDVGSTRHQLCVSAAGVSDREPDSAERKHDATLSEE